MINLETPVTTEIDDYRHAEIIVEEIHSCRKELRMALLAEWCARLREYYVEVGKQLD